MDSKQEVKTEIITIKSTERWRDFKKTMKWIFMGIFFIVFLWGLYLVFSGYVFYSFFLSLFICSVILYNKIDVPSQNYIECRIEIDTTDKGVEKMGNYLFNEYKIPDNLLKEFTIKGFTKIIWKSKNGKIRHICEKIDWKNKIIYYCWLSGLSDWEMQIKIDTFKKMKEKFEEIPRDLSRNEESRPIYHSLEFVKIIQDQNRDVDLTPQEKKIEQKLKEIFKDDKSINVK